MTSFQSFCKKTLVAKAIKYLNSQTKVRHQTRIQLITGHIFLLANRTKVNGWKTMTTNFYNKERVFHDYTTRPTEFRSRHAEKPTDFNSRFGNYIDNTVSKDPYKRSKALMDVVLRHDTYFPWGILKRPSLPSKMRATTRNSILIIRKTRLRCQTTRHEAIR